MKNLKTLVLGAIIMLAIVMLYDYYKSYRAEKEELIAQTALIEREINQVRKLVVTEASYAKIYNYQNTKSYGWDFFTSQKKALVSSNTRVQVIYDLKELGYEIDAVTKTITITSIPDPEITIDPDLQFYDLDNGWINNFEAQDFNNIKSRIKNDINAQVLKSDIIKNADDRLLSELASIYALSSSMDWRIVYDGGAVESTTDFLK